MTTKNSILSVMEWLGEIWAILPGKSTAIAGKVTVTTAGTAIPLPNQPCGEGATFIAAGANACQCRCDFV